MEGLVYKGDLLSEEIADVNELGAHELEYLEIDCGE